MGLRESNIGQNILNIYGKFMPQASRHISLNRQLYINNFREQLCQIASFRCSSIANTFYRHGLTDSLTNQTKIDPRQFCYEPLQAHVINKNLKLYLNEPQWQCAAPVLATVTYGKAQN